MLPCQRLPLTGHVALGPGGWDQGSEGRASPRGMQVLPIRPLIFREHLICDDIAIKRVGNNGAGVVVRHGRPAVMVVAAAVVVIVMVMVVLWTE